jgi:glycosyltransferase involved in cell wall biosynthesis
MFEYAAFAAAAGAAAAVRHLRRRFDAVQVHTVPDGLVFAALVPKLLGSKVVLDLHELMPELYASKRGVSLASPVPRLLALQERLAVRFADHCIAVSHPCLDRFAARGLPLGKFTVVMNSADPALFAREPDSPEGTGSSRAVPAAPGFIRAGAPDGPPHRLVSHGTLVKRYGYSTLIRAVDELPAARLEIIGEGDHRASLERLARDLGVAERVSFAGFVPLRDVTQRIRGATLGIVPNESDVFTDLVVPTKLLEYVALRIPAVVSRTPAIEAYFDDESVAFFRPGDAADLAATIGRLLDQPEERRRMAARAAERYAATMAWPLQRRRYLELYQGLLKDRHANPYSS